MGRLRDLPKLKVENLPPLGRDLARFGEPEMRPSLLNRNDELSLVYRVFQAAVLRRTVTSERFAKVQQAAHELDRRLAEVLADVSDAHKNLIDPQLPVNIDRAAELTNHESRQELAMVNRFMTHQAKKGVYYYLGCRAAQETDFHSAQISSLVLDGPADATPRSPLPVVLNEAGERRLLPATAVIDHAIYETSSAALRDLIK